MSDGIKKVFSNMKSLGEGLFKTTVTSTTIINGDMPPEFDEAFKTADKAFGTMDEAFDQMSKGFDKLKDPPSTTISTVELVRATKDAALHATDPYAFQGYRLDKLEEDPKLGVWKATLSLKKD